MYGSLSNNIYRGAEIQKIATAVGSNSCHYNNNPNISCMTEIKFKSAPNDLSDIKARINGHVYTFRRADDKSWGCNDRIFTTTGTYTFEFLD